MYLFVIIFCYLSAVKVRTLIFWGWFLLPLMWFKTNWMIFCILLRQKKNPGGMKPDTGHFLKRICGKQGSTAMGGRACGHSWVPPPQSLFHNETWIKMTEDNTAFYLHFSLSWYQGLEWTVSPMWYSQSCILGDKIQGHSCISCGLCTGCSIISKINLCKTWEDVLFPFAVNDFINLSGACQ